MNDELVARLEAERLTGMPRWNVRRPAPRPAAETPDEASRRRRMRDDLLAELANPDTWKAAS